MSNNGIIYVTQNLVNGKIYIGIHTKNEKEYLGSGMYLNRAITKYGRDNFRRIDVDEFDSLDIGLAKERVWIRELNSKVPSGYNLNAGGEGQFDPSLEVRAKMSMAHKDKPNLKLRGKPHSKEHKVKNSMAKMGKHPSEETKAKMSSSHKGNRNSRFGKHLNAAHKAKVSATWKGRHHGKESKSKMSMVHKGRSWSSARRAAYEKVWKEKSDY